MKSSPETSSLALTKNFENEKNKKNATARLYVVERDRERERKQ
jgi:hypothetical protein